MDRHQDAIGVHPRQTLGIEVLRAVRAERDRRRAQLVVDGGGGEGAVEHHARQHVAPAQVRRDRAGGEQAGVDREIAEAALRQIEQAARIDDQRVRPQLDAGIRAPLGDAGVDRDLERRRRQPLDRAFEIEAGSGEAVHLETAVTRDERQIGELAAAQRGIQPAAPVGPGAAPAERGDERRLQPAERGDDAAGGRRQPRVDRQPIVVGHRIQAHAQPIPARNAGRAHGSGIDRQLGAPIGDMGRPVDADDVALPGHRRLQHEPVDPQAIDVDVQIGQQRRVRIGRLRDQLGIAAHRDEPAGEALHVDVIVDERERPPVHVEPRRIEEDALGIADAQVGQHHAAVERTVDPADADVQPAGRLVVADLVGDEATARIGVDPEQHDQHQRHQRKKRDADPAQDAEPQRPMHDDGRVGGGKRLVRHQKACPIEM